MLGIVSYGAYVPYYRLKKETIAQAFGKRGGKGAKAVAYCDEDSLTMSVAAAMDACAGNDLQDLAGVYFASVSAPYREKQCAAELVAVLNAGENLRTGDYAGNLRAGSAAILSACDQLAQTGGKAVVTMADCRLGAADGKFESDLGDGAAAFLLGSEDVLANLDASCSVSKNAIDEWRAADDVYLRNWDVRYANTQLYTPLVKAAVSQLLAKADVQPADIAKVVLYGHDDKTRNGLAAKLGFAPEQIVPSLYAEIGNTGNAAAGIMLASALDEAQPGQRILVVTYGDGCDAMLFTVTEKARTYKAANSVAALLAHKNDTLAYGKYLKWKGMIDCEPQKRPPQERSALPDYFRNYRKNHNLVGCKCTNCGTVVFPPQRVCVHCRSIDTAVPYSFLDKKATVRTFTIDGLSLSLDSPNYLVVIEFEGGGKMMTYLVDCKKEDIQVGMAVRPSYRKMFEANGVQTYFWKVIPAGEEAVQ